MVDRVDYVISLFILGFCCSICAFQVLVDNVKDLNRAKEFAERVADKAVWSKVCAEGIPFLPESLDMRRQASYIRFV